MPKVTNQNLSWPIAGKTIYVDKGYFKRASRGEYTTLDKKIDNIWNAIKKAFREKAATTPHEKLERDKDRISLTAFCAMQEGSDGYQGSMQWHRVVRIVPNDNSPASVVFRIHWHLLPIQRRSMRAMSVLRGVRRPLIFRQRRDGVRDTQ